MLAGVRPIPGMWEIVTRLDAKLDVLFEEERARVYPQWAELAHPARLRLMELQQRLREAEEEVAQQMAQEAAQEPSETSGSAGDGA